MEISYVRVGNPGRDARTKKNNCGRIEMCKVGSVPGWRVEFSVRYCLGVMYIHGLYWNCRCVGECCVQCYIYMCVYGIWGNAEGIFTAIVIISTLKETQPSCQSSILHSHPPHLLENEIITSLHLPIFPSASPHLTSPHPPPSFSPACPLLQGHHHAYAHRYLLLFCFIRIAFLLLQGHHYAHIHTH
jgi:hypothetical protein